MNFQDLKLNFNKNREDTVDKLVSDEILDYSFKHCIFNVFKIDLSKEEKECILNRSYTYLATIEDFKYYQKNNFKY